jgi:hypothetical protein
MQMTLCLSLSNLKSLFLTTPILTTIPDQADCLQLIDPHGLVYHFAQQRLSSPLDTLFLFVISIYENLQAAPSLLQKQSQNASHLLHQSETTVGKLTKKSALCIDTIQTKHSKIKTNVSRGELESKWNR